ncbi:MAG TPA: serine/threonine-protein kinase [Planctomycetota bacterium]
MPTIHSNQASGSGLHLRMPRVAGFTLLEPIHDGSCGYMYRARQDRLGRIVALKLLPEWPPPTDLALERFNRAAYVNAQTPHPNLLTLYDTGTKDGFHYISLEFVNGQTLQQRMGEIGAADERLALHIATNVLRALEALHTREICHRNVKPKNIFLESCGNVKLIGTGLCSCKTAFFSPHLDARPIGTPHFMAPEMIRGCFADPRSDLYSLGVTLYVMVTGRTPFEKGAPLAVMSRHLTDMPSPVSQLRPDLPGDLATFIDTLMAREPEQRFQSARAALQVAEALAQRSTPSPLAQPQHPLPVPAAVPLSRVLAGFIRSKTGVALIAAFATLLLLGLMMLLASHFAESRRARVEPGPKAVEAPLEPADPAETAEFSKLLDQDAVFARRPELGAEGWAGFLARFPKAGAARRSFARQRLETFVDVQNKRATPARPTTDNPDF